MVRFAEKCSRGLLNTTYVLLVWPIGFGFALTIGRLAMWCFTSSLELFGLAWPVKTHTAQTRVTLGGRHQCFFMLTVALDWEGLGETDAGASMRL